jgi:TatD DNase family protein
MLVDTHCHINMMVKKEFDELLTKTEVDEARTIVNEALAQNVSCIINVGTNAIESLNCVTLARCYAPIFAAVGIHPNDCEEDWKDDLKMLTRLVKDKKKNKIVAIGECGIDRHYPDYNLARQKDAFKAQIELALENDLALIVHTRDAADETLRSLEEFKGQITRGVIHCFSEDQSFADQTIAWGFVLGIGGTITYPKNNYLRDIVKKVGLEHIVLETDAPFLPPQAIRGKQNSPAQINAIAHYVAELTDTSFEIVAKQTYTNSKQLFNI